MNQSEGGKYALQKVQIRNTVGLEEAEKQYKKITKRKPRKVRETENFYQFRYLPPTKFESRSFRTKVVSPDIHLIFGKLKEQHPHLEGKGLWDYFTKAYDYVANKASGAFDYVKNAISINDFSTKTKANLDKYGDYPFLTIQVRRVPIAFALDLALQGISAGEWEKQKQKFGFDKFFHLSMVVTLKGAKEIVMNTGRKVRVAKQLAIEKLEVVSVNENIEVGEGMETLNVPIPKGQNITINKMFEKAREKVGDTKFFSYSALGQNNCQDFIGLLLDVEGLYTEPVKEFVYQDITELSKALPDTTVGISQGITYLGALANKYLGVGGNRVTLDDLYKEKIGKGKSDIVIPKAEFVKEHKHLIGLLNSSDDPVLKKEAEAQSKELEMKGGAVPINKKLYEKVKSIVYPKYKKPSAYRSGAVVKLYKEMGGKFKDNGERKLARWYKEEWKDVGNQEYPVYRPTKRVTKDTPLTVTEIDPKNLKEQIKEKQVIRGDSNLKPFKETEGGNKASGYIRALMAKDSTNQDVHNKFYFNIVDANERRGEKRAKGDKRVKDHELDPDKINEAKFGDSEFKPQDMSKATTNLLKTRRRITKKQAIKNFYKYVLENAKLHDPQYADGANYRGTYDIDDLFDKWKEDNAVDIEAYEKEDARDKSKCKLCDKKKPTNFYGTCADCEKKAIEEQKQRKKEERKKERERKKIKNI